MESQAQTLARGLRILDVLAEAGRPLSIAEVCTQLDVHRSVGYRLVRTLEDAALIVRDPSGSLVLGPHLATLARSVAPDLQSQAQPVLRQLADELGMTAFLVVLDRTECVTLVTVEPRDAVASIAQRPGSRHSMLVGAPGIAVQSLLTTVEREALALPMPEPDEVATARRDGIARSAGEVIPGVSAVASPVRGAVRAAVAVLFVSRDDDTHVADTVRRAAATLTRSNW
ncbi:MAG: helix-turn-helix domain-containing protein [Leifsonia sp.]|nr:helix-turn-helix domain-containing protein [Leifsonia sp.]